MSEHTKFLETNFDSDEAFQSVLHHHAKSGQKRLKTGQELSDPYSLQLACPERDNSGTLTLSLEHTAADLSEIIGEAKDSTNFDEGSQMPSYNQKKWSYTNDDYSEGLETGAEFSLGEMNETYFFDSELEGAAGDSEQQEQNILADLGSVNHLQEDWESVEEENPGARYSEMEPPQRQDTFDFSSVASGNPPPLLKDTGTYTGIASSASGSEDKPADQLRTTDIPAVSTSPKLLI